MGTTRTERAKDPGGCGGEDRGLWGKGGRLSPHSRASRRGDSRLGRGDRSGSDRHGCSGGRWDKEGAYGQRIGLGCPARTLPRVGGARVRSLTRSLPTVSTQHFPLFTEVPRRYILPPSPRRSSPTFLRCYYASGYGHDSLRGRGLHSRGRALGRRPVQDVLAEGPGGDLLPLRLGGACFRWGRWKVIRAFIHSSAQKVCSRKVGLRRLQLALALVVL